MSVIRLKSDLTFQAEGHRHGSARWSRPSHAWPAWFPSAAGDSLARAPVRRRGPGLSACSPGFFETVLEDPVDSPVGSVNSLHYSVSSPGDPPLLRDCLGGSCRLSRALCQFVALLCELS